MEKTQRRRREKKRAAECECALHSLIINFTEKQAPGGVAKRGIFKKEGMTSRKIKAQREERIFI
jgi:hypothetical protein